MNRGKLRNRRVGCRDSQIVAPMECSMHRIPRHRAPVGYLHELQTVTAAVEVDRREAAGDIFDDPHGFAVRRPVGVRQRWVIITREDG